MPLCSMEFAQASKGRDCRPANPASRSTSNLTLLPQPHLSLEQHHHLQT